MSESVPGLSYSASVDVTPGLETSQPFVVEGPLVTDVGGTLGFSVLSTPGMIGQMERTCAMLVYPKLPEGKATVGFEVCVRHVGSAPEGMRCTARVRLREFVDDRKFRFDVEVLDADGRTIGIGTHERRLVDASR